MNANSFAWLAAKHAHYSFIDNNLRWEELTTTEQDIFQSRVKYEAYLGFAKRKLDELEGPAQRVRS